MVICAEVIERVVDHLSRSNASNWPPGVEELVDRLHKYQELLADYTQAQVLQGLGRGAQWSTMLSNCVFHSISLSPLQTNDGSFSRCGRVTIHFRRRVQTRNHSWPGNVSNENFVLSLTDAHNTTYENMWSD